MNANVLVIAGLDPACRAGLLADAEAVWSAGARPLLCAAATTIQTSRSLRGHHSIPAEVLERQILALVEEEGVAAVKLGMLGSAENARMLASLMDRPPFSGIRWVIDPVLRASSGPPLFEGAAELYRLLCRPNALLTPNLAEAGALAGLPQPACEAAMRACASVLLEAGAGAVLVKGGHLEGEALDLLVRPDREVRLPAVRLSEGRRGTGCRLASFLAGRLAQGDAVEEASRGAKEAVRYYLKNGKLPAPTGTA